MLERLRSGLLRRGIHAMRRGVRTAQVRVRGSLFVVRLIDSLTGHETPSLVPVTEHTLQATTRGPLVSVNDRDPTWTGVRDDAALMQWSLLHGVRMNDTSLVLSDGRLIAATGRLHDIQSGFEFKGPGIFAHDRGSVLVESSDPVRRIDGGIRLCGFGSANWYHWLVEILPAAALLDRLPLSLRGLPLLVPEAVATRGAWREALETIAPDHEWSTVPRNAVIDVDRLVWMDPAIAGPPTLRDGALPSPRLIAPVTEALQRFRRAVLDQSLTSAAPVPLKRVILVRPDGTKRSANQLELIEVAEQRGFIPVDLGALPFHDQVRIFAGAEHVVGGWGAAWASMLFASPQLRALMWAPELFRTWPLFSQLAPLSGMQLRTLYIPTEERTFRAANEAAQFIPPDRFAAELDSIL